MNAPQTRYAKSGDLHIAYQVTGEGPLDLVLVPGWVSNLETMWQDPDLARLLLRLASFSRLILFDKRGTGLSDRVSLDALPTLEQRMDDVRAVMDAAGSERAALTGISEGGPMCALFAATYPQRTRALVMYGAYACWIRDDDFPWAPAREEHERAFEIFERHWGEPVGLSVLAPSMADDESFRQRFATQLRTAASPAAGVGLYRMNVEIDVREVLPAIRVPTLVVHRTGDRLIPVKQARYIAKRIPGARLLELPGDDHIVQVGDVDSVVDEIEEFLTGARPVPEPERALATILFTDIAGSTQTAAQLGDRRWRAILDAHDAAVRASLARWRGRLVNTMGDGTLAVFDGPARGIRCALDIAASVAPLDLRVRSGLHTGEVELRGDDVGGISVHVAARVAGLAGPGEVLVSRTVRDLIAGSGIRLADRGDQVLRGLEEPWRVFAVET